MSQQNTGPASAWRKTAIRDDWQHIVDTGHSITPAEYAMKEERMMEVVVTTGATYKTRKAPVRMSPPTNQHPVFYRPDAFLSSNQQCQSPQSRHVREQYYDCLQYSDTTGRTSQTASDHEKYRLSNAQSLSQEDQWWTSHVW